MTRLAVRAVAALVCAAAAVLLALAAVDVLRWPGQELRADVALDRLSADPGIWEPRTILPTSVSRWLVGNGDDVAFGRALQRFLILRANGFELGGNSTSGFTQSQVDVARAELDFERLAAKPLRPELKARAQQLQAIMLFQQLLSQQTPVETALQSSLDGLGRAVRTDPSSASAKTSLEQVLDLFAGATATHAGKVPLPRNRPGAERGRGGSPGSLSGEGGF